MTAATLADRVIEVDPDEGLRLLRGEPVVGVSREYFERVVELAGSNPEAALRAVSKWRVVFRAGDEPAYALRARGVGERLEGRWLQSARTFLFAGRSASGPVDKLAFSVGAVDSLARAGKVAEALRLGTSMARSLQDLGKPEIAAKIFLNLGNALLWQDRYLEARRFFERAVPLLAGSEAATERSAALLGLSTSHLFAGDPQESIEHALAAKEGFLRAGSGVHAATCEVNVAHASILLGEPDKAVGILLEIGPAFAALPVEASNVQEFLGDAYLRLNLWEESIDSFGAALSRRPLLPPANVANCLLGRGIAGAAMGRRLEARRHLTAAARLYERLGILPWQAAALSALARLELAAGRLAAAKKAADSALLSGRRGGSSYHRAAALLASAHVGIALGAPIEDTIKQTSRIIVRNRFLGLAWEIPWLRARSATGQAKLRLLRQAYRLILDHRVLTTSLASRMSYLRDKESVLRELLGELLSSPTARRVREAVRILEQTRSVALLDEIASSDSLGISGETAGRLSELRRRLASANSEPIPGDPTRRGQSRVQRMISVRREWMELTRTMGLGTSSSRTLEPRDSVVFAEAKGSLYALNGHRAIQLGMRLHEVERDLAWLRFELQSPLAADTEERLLGVTMSRLSQALVAPWIQRWSPSLCLADSLWHLPWPALIHQLGSDAEPVYCLHPSAQLPAGPLPVSSDAPVCLWLGRAANIPHAVAEANVIRRRFKNVVVADTAAAARETLSSGNYQLLHIAAHANHNPSNPMFSYVEFEDGQVYANEVAQSRLKASFVNLAACSTATLSTTISTEPDGLARAFLARGAAGILGSLWPLNDEASLIFNERFYAELSYDKGVTQCVSHARKAVRDWRSHPFYWSTLVLFGGYAKGDPRS